MMRELSFRAAFILIVITVISCSRGTETSTPTAAINSAAPASGRRRDPAVTLSQNDLRRMFAYERRENFMGKVGLWDATSGQKLIEDWPKGETSTVLGDPERILIGCADLEGHSRDRLVHSDIGELAGVGRVGQEPLMCQRIRYDGYFAYPQIFPQAFIIAEQEAVILLNRSPQRSSEFIPLEEGKGFTIKIVPGVHSRVANVLIG